MSPPPRAVRRARRRKIVLTGSMPKLGGGMQQVRATFEQTGPNEFVQRWERAKGAGWEPLVMATYTRR